MRSVVVTGASTGIGWAIAKDLIGRGYRVFGSVRKQADADRLIAELGPNVAPLLFDVTDEAAVKAAADVVEKAPAPARRASANLTPLDAQADTAPAPAAGSGIFDLGRLEKLLCTLEQGH